jgi:restriction system protein
MVDLCFNLFVSSTQAAIVNIRSKAQSAILSVSSASEKFAKKSKDQILDAARGLANNSPSVSGVREWVVSLFVKSISKCSVEQDRIDAILWLTLVREILDRPDLSTVNKSKKIFALTDTKRLAMNVFRGVGEAYRTYKNSEMPLAVKVAIPITLTAGAILGGPSVGIAGFGSAIGVPVLLVIFLGVAGVTSVLEAVLSGSEAKSYVAIVAYMIANDEALRRSNHAMRKAMAEEPVAPQRCDLAGAFAEDIQMMFSIMDPFDFERHVMSYFQDAGLFAWVTKKSNDAGVDGFARHSNGLIVVQCKRNSEENNVGRPTVQQFKGVVEENEAWKGFIVTTSRFTREAMDSASKNSRVILIGIDELVLWHRNGIEPSKYFAQSDC